MNSHFETIKNLAEKLAALCAPESGATAGERDVAKRKLKRLLERHGLTAADLAAEQTFTMWERCENAGERALLHQCAFFVLETNRITVTRVRKGSKDAGIGGVTVVQIADIRACFRYYLAQLRERLAEIDEELKTLKAARKVAHLAIIAKNDIHPPDTPEGGKSLSPAKLAALVKAMQGLEKNRWEKPAGKVGDGVFALTNE